MLSSRSKELFHKICNINREKLFRRKKYIKQKDRLYFTTNYRLLDDKNKNNDNEPKILDMKNILYGEEVPLSELEHEENVLKIDSQSLRKGIEYCML